MENNPYYFVPGDEDTFMWAEFEHHVVLGRYSDMDENEWCVIESTYSGIESHGGNDVWVHAFYFESYIDDTGDPIMKIRLEGAIIDLQVQKTYELKSACDWNVVDGQLDAEWKIDIYYI